VNVIRAENRADDAHQHEGDQEFSLSSRDKAPSRDEGHPVGQARRACFETELALGLVHQGRKHWRSVAMAMKTPEGACMRPLRGDMTPRRQIAEFSVTPGRNLGLVIAATIAIWGTMGSWM
jgi:hypothetical protein